MMVQSANKDDADGRNTDTESSPGSGKQRRSALGTGVAAWLSGIVGCLAPAGRDSGDEDAPPTSPDERIPPGTWPQVAYDARNTRHVRDARGPRDDASVAWAALGDRPAYAPVVGDALYLTEAWTDGPALAIASEDGSMQWTNTDLPPIRWSPALDDDLVFVVSREEGNVVRLHALRTATGEQAWVRQEGITASSGGRPPNGPTVRDGTIYLPSNRGVVACDAGTGSIEWTATLGPHVVETEGPIWRTDWATPAVTADRAYTFDMNDSYRREREVYAVDRETGDRDWTATLSLGEGWSLKGHVVAGDGQVFVSALDPHVALLSGDSEWSGTERLFALEAASGAITWQWEPPRKTLSPPAYADGTLYVGEWYPDADTGRLHAVDATDGSIDWTYRTDAGAVLAPTVAGDTVYVGQGEAVAAVARADGSRRWRVDVGARAGSIVVVGDALFALTDPGRNRDSQLVAIRAP